MTKENTKLRDIREYIWGINVGRVYNYSKPKTNSTDTYKMLIILCTSGRENKGPTTYCEIETI